jgi:hypothetical protein
MSSSVPILNAKSTSGIGPLNVVEDVTDDAARPALDTALVREQDPSVILWSIAIRGATVDTLLARALQTDVAINDPDVHSCAIDVVDVEREFLIDRGRIEDA